MAQRIANYSRAGHLAVHLRVRAGSTPYPTSRAASSLSISIGTVSGEQKRMIMTEIITPTQPLPASATRLYSTIDKSTSTSTTFGGGALAITGNLVTESPSNGINRERVGGGLWRFCGAIRGKSSLPTSALPFNDSPYVVQEDGTEKFLIATRDLEPGEEVFGLTGGSVSAVRTRHSISVGADQFLIVDNELELLNHSCAPTCKIEVVEESATGQPACLRAMVRNASVKEGDLLTLDYNAMEVDMCSPFDCECGAAKCRGRIAGFRNLPSDVQKEYLKTSTHGGEAVDGPPPVTDVVRSWARQNAVHV